MKIEYTELTWLDDHHPLSLNDLVALSGLSVEEIHHLVDSGAITPIDPAAEPLHFNSQMLVSIRTLNRLKHDFELEPNSISLILVFLERVRLLESELHILKSHHTVQRLSQIR